MGLVMKEEASFVQCPAGNHLAICYAVIDLGTQHNDAFSWEGKPIAESDKPQILIMWEIPAELVEIEGEMKPAGISKFYNAFFSDRASLRIHLEAWRGKPFTQEELEGFNIANLIGKPCMLNVIHNDKGKAKIAGVAALPRGMVTPKQVNESIMFDLSNYDQAIFDSISDGIKTIIQKSPEWQALNQPAQGFRQDVVSTSQGVNTEPPGFEDDDIPF